MKYINELTEGSRVAGIYLCKQKQSAVTKNGKPYDNLTLADKTGSINAKVWEVDSPGIGDYEALDYIEVMGDVTRFAGALQLSLKRVRVAGEGEYDPADYLPATDKDQDAMLHELRSIADGVHEPNLRSLLLLFFGQKAAFAKQFRDASAAKSIHHGFIGGLLEHTLSVTKFCCFMAEQYPFLDRDLLVTAAMLHDIGKTRELSDFPLNDYTDEGQLLGHIVIGVEMIHDAIRELPGFPDKLARELKHCIVAHHGELTYGSPKKPALAEALALSLADITDARMESLKELFAGATEEADEWLGYQKIFESNMRRTGSR